MSNYIGVLRDCELEQFIQFAKDDSVMRMKPDSKNLIWWYKVPLCQENCAGDTHNYVLFEHKDDDNKDCFLGVSKEPDDICSASVILPFCSESDRKIIAQSAVAPEIAFSQDFQIAAIKTSLEKQQVYEKISQLAKKQAAKSTKQIFLSPACKNTIMNINNCLDWGLTGEISLWLWGSFVTDLLQTSPGLLFPDDMEPFFFASYNKAMYAQMCEKYEERIREAFSHLETNTPSKEESTRLFLIYLLMFQKTIDYLIKLLPLEKQDKTLDIKKAITENLPDFKNTKMPSISVGIRLDDSEGVEKIKLRTRCLDKTLLVSNNFWSGIWFHTGDTIDTSEQSLLSTCVFNSGSQSQYEYLIPWNKIAYVKAGKKFIYRE